MRQLAIGLILAGFVRALGACPSDRAASIPPGEALAPPSTATAPAAAEHQRDAAPRQPPARFSIRRVDQCEVPPIPEADAGTVAMDMDVAYGADERQVLDIAYPTGPAKGLVVIVHGGGWTAGTKKLFHPTVRQLANLGYAAATLNYRLARSSENAFPVGLADVRCGIRLAQHLAENRQIDGKKLVLVGASAGGHLAAMVGVDGDDAKLDQSCERKGPIEARGVIAYYAPLELDRAADHYPPKMQQAVDELLREDAGPARDAKAKAATPSHYVDASDAPVLLLHGSDDRVVPVSDSRAFASALEAAGVPALVVELPGQDHGFAVLAKKESVRAATCTALAFLEDAVR